MVPYVIFYEAIDDGVRIVRVLHGSRDTTAQFDEDS
jgi:plasmid stabilization system protein ParE